MPNVVQYASTLPQKIYQRLRRLAQGRLKQFDSYLPYLQNRKGLEIGGPSKIFRRGNLLPVYEVIGGLDNCDFSKSTVWAKHSDNFQFSPRKSPGTSFFLDGSNLSEIADSTYDVVLSSHNLEHMANPVKALKEWQRVLVPGGALVLVLPDYRTTFDHRREPTSVDHMLSDFERGIGEDDLTHLAEILEKHDLAMDQAAGSKDEFRERSLNNIANRCLHQHVFDEFNSRELLSRIGFEVLSVELAFPIHICILARTQG
jgi:SAM-dependent methyltransferase